MLLFYFLATSVSLSFEASAFIQLDINHRCVIPANESAATPIWQTSPPMPSAHPGYRVTNLGTVPVRASIYWKDSWPLQTDDEFCQDLTNCSTNSSVNVWYELDGPVLVEPSESAVISPSNPNNFHYTRLVIISNYSHSDGDDEPDVNVAYEKIGIVRSELPLSGRLKKLLLFDGTYDSPKFCAFSGLTEFVDLFWPQHEISVWDEVRAHVRHLVDPKTFNTINSFLSRRLMQFKEELESVAEKIDKSDASIPYMNLARSFIGLEEECIIRGHYNAKKLNEDLLPVYSNVVLMKAAFYNFGLHHVHSLGDHNEATLKTIFTEMLRSPTHGANHHVSQIFRGQDNVQNFEYSKEVHARNKIKEHGYIPIWNSLLDANDRKFLGDKIFYSNFVGCYYTGEDVFAPPMDPLSSAGLSNGQHKYNDIRELILYQRNAACENCCADAIVGMKLKYRLGETSEFGEITPVFRSIQLSDNYRISKIEARDPSSYGLANLRISLLTLTNGRWTNSTQNEYTFGCPSDNSSTIFTLAKEDYYIASVYAFFDNPPRRYNIAYPLYHIGASFLPLESETEHLLLP